MKSEVLILEILFQGKWSNPLQPTTVEWLHLIFVHFSVVAG